MDEIDALKIEILKNTHKHPARLAAEISPDGSPAVNEWLAENELERLLDGDFAGIAIVVNDALTPLPAYRP